MKFRLRKRAKETFALALGMLMVFGTLGVPMKADAASYTITGTNSFSTNDFFVPGDQISFTEEHYGQVVIEYTNIFISTVEGGRGFYYPDPIDTSQSDAFRVYKGTGGGYEEHPCYPSTFVLSAVPDALEDKMSEYGEGYGLIFQYDVTEDKGTGIYHGKSVYSTNILARFGFRIQHYDVSGNPITSTGGVVYNYRTPKKDASDTVYYLETESQSLSVNPTAEVAGWSTVQGDYDAVVLTGVTVGPNQTISFARFGTAAKAASNSTLKLYPIKNRAPVNTTVSMSGYTLTDDGTVPSGVTGPVVTKQTGDNRTYTIKYYPAADGEPVAGAAGSASLPTEPGNYVVTVSAEATDTLFDGNGNVVTRGLEAEEVTVPFRVEKPLSSGKVKAKELTYNGRYQELVETETAAKGGTIVYGEEEGGPFTSTVPTGKNPGNYTVFYKVQGDANHEDSGVESVEAVIAKKELKLSWSNTSFDTDGKDHCPTATLIGVATGDDCKVTVTGGQKKAGTYTATATISGADLDKYILPENRTVSFTIGEKKNGTASVTMGSYTYGGSATTPVVTSSTHDASQAKIAYKASGAPDSAYSAKKPTEVGTYTVRAILPENDRYKECVATATFTISYLPVPQGAFEITGKKGYGGWYTSEVQLIPAAEYEISVGDRTSFRSGTITLSEEMAGRTFYIRKKDTGEQTGGITISALQIDADAPTVDMENDNIYFCDEEGKLLAMARDKNLDKIFVDGKEVEVMDDGNGGKLFELPVGKKKQSVSVKVVDQAGNEKTLNVITAPAWMKDGIVGEGEYYLETGTAYKTPAEGTCYLEADGCEYMWGIVFYAKNEGDHTFHMH